MIITTLQWLVVLLLFLGSAGEVREIISLRRIFFFRIFLFQTGSAPYPIPRPRIGGGGADDSSAASTHSCFPEMGPAMKCNRGNGAQ